MSTVAQSDVISFVFDGEQHTEDTAREFLKGIGHDDLKFAKSDGALVAPVRVFHGATEVRAIEGFDGISAVLKNVKAGGPLTLKMGEKKEEETEETEEKPPAPVTTEDTESSEGEHEVEEEKGGDGPYGRRVMTAFREKMSGLADEYDAAAGDIEQPEVSEWGRATSETMRAMIKGTEEMHDGVYGEGFDKMGSEEAPEGDEPKPDEEKCDDGKCDDENPEESEEEMAKTKAARAARKRTLKNAFFDKVRIPLTFAKSVANAAARLVHHGETEAADKLSRLAAVDAMHVENTKTARTPEESLKSGKERVAIVQENTQISTAIATYKANGTLEDVIKNTPDDTLCKDGELLKAKLQRAL